MKQNAINESHDKRSNRKIKLNNKSGGKHKKNKKDNKNIGNKGEDIAAMFLIKQGYEIICRNYCKKQGEIDIIAFYNDTVHFIEVKTVSRETSSSDFVGSNDYVVEEKISHIKKLHMKHAIESFIYEFGLPKIICIDLIVVSLYKSGEVPRINFVDNIII